MTHKDKIDMHLAEIDGLMDAVIMLAEDGEAHDRIRRRDAALAILYCAVEKLRLAQKLIGFGPI